MSFIYECKVMGRLGKDAELQIVDNGSKVVKFPLCYKKTFKTSTGELKETVTWFECSYWRGPNENVEVHNLLKKGDLVYIDGTVGAQAYEAKDGTPTAYLTFKVTKVTLIPTHRRGE